MKTETIEPIGKRKDILDYISARERVGMWPPSLREICREVGLSSPSSVKRHMDWLVNAGLVERLENQPRCIKLKK